MSSEIELSGIDGGNPLGFLAALGAFRTLAITSPFGAVSLGWRDRAAWRPVLQLAKSTTKDEVIAVLDKQLRTMKGHPAFQLGDDLKASPEEFKEYVRHAAEADDPRWAEFAASFGCEAVSDDGVIQDTALRTMSGAGHQHFLKSMRDLVEATTMEHLHAALFVPWSYKDDPPTMRWDPADDRRYALRWQNPSGDKIRTVRGANRLGIEGIPLLPTMPKGLKLYTTGFSGRGSRDTYWTWPIWRAPLSLDAVRSVLALQEIQAPRPTRPLLERRGIVEVYRSQRLTIGKFRSFAPPQTV